MTYFLQYLLPGLLLILMGFWAGTQKNLFFAFASFIGFFVIGVTLIVEGKKRTQKKTH